MLSHTADVSSLHVAALLFLSFLHSFPCPLLIFSSHTVYQCDYHSVSFQPTASGFTWLSLAGLLYCSRGWLLTGIDTLLGPWLVNVNAQTVSARCWWHFGELLGLWNQVCQEDKDYVCSQTLRFLHRRATSNGLQKSRAEEAARYGLHAFESGEPMEKAFQ